MLKLSEKLKKNGFTYTQVSRGDRSCIYAQHVSEKEVYYEVFLIRERSAGMLNGKYYEAREIFPHNEAFGYWAWSFRSYEDAYLKYIEIEAGESTSKSQGEYEQVCVTNGQYCLFQK